MLDKRTMERVLYADLKGDNANRIKAWENIPGQKIKLSFANADEVAEVVEVIAQLRSLDREMPDKNAVITDEVLMQMVEVLNTHGIDSHLQIRETALHPSYRRDNYSLYVEMPDDLAKEVLALHDHGKDRAAKMFQQHGFRLLEAEKEHIREALSRAIDDGELNITSGPLLQEKVVEQLLSIMVEAKMARGHIAEPARNQDTKKYISQAIAQINPYTRLNIEQAVKKFLPEALSSENTDSCIKQARDTVAAAMDNELTAGRSEGKGL